MKQKKKSDAKPDESKSSIQEKKNWFLFVGWTPCSMYSIRWC